MVTLTATTMCLQQTMGQRYLHRRPGLCYPFGRPFAVGYLVVGLSSHPTSLDAVFLHFPPPKRRRPDRNRSGCAAVVKLPNVRSLSSIHDVPYKCALEGERFSWVTADSRNTRFSLLDLQDSSDRIPRIGGVVLDPQTPDCGIPGSITTPQGVRDLANSI